MIKSSRGVRSNGNSYSNGNKKKSVVCKIKRGIKGYNIIIIGRYTQIKKHNGKVYVCSMNQLVERIFMLSGLKKICEVGKTEEDVERMMGVTA